MCICMLIGHARRVKFPSANPNFNPLGLVKRWKLATIDKLRHIDVANEIAPGRPLPDMESLWNNDQAEVASLENEPLTVRYGFNESDLRKVLYRRHKDCEAEGLTARMREGIRGELTKRNEMRSRVPGQHNHNHVRRRRWDQSTPETQMLQDFVSCIACCMVRAPERSFCP